LAASTAGATYGAAPPTNALTLSAIALEPTEVYASSLAFCLSLFSIPGSTPNRAYAGIPEDMTDCPGRTVGG